MASYWFLVVCLQMNPDLICLSSLKSNTFQFRSEAEYFSSSPLFLISTKLVGKKSWITEREHPPTFLTWAQPLCPQRNTAHLQSWVSSRKLKFPSPGNRAMQG